jgi:carboxypeptidase family protein
MPRIILTLCLGGTLAAPGQPGATKQPPAQVSGHVYRSDTGAPVDKAEVGFLPQDAPTSRAAGNSFVARTGPDGAFTMSNLPAGSYAVKAWRVGFTSYGCRGGGNADRESVDCKLLSVGPGEIAERVDLRLTPAGIIAGMLVDDDQDPVAGVEADVLRLDYLPGGRRQLSLVATAVSDDQGRFRVAGLRPDTYYIRAGGLIRRPREEVPLKEGPSGGLQYRETYYPGTALLDDAQALDVGPGEENSSIRISLATERTYTVWGTIVDPGQDAARRASDVEALKRADAEQTWGPGGVSIARDGSFTIRRVSPGDYTLIASAVDAGRRATAGFGWIQVVNADVHATIELGRAGEVRGRIAEAQRLSSEGRRIVLESTGMSIYPADVDATGRFDVRNLPPGEYTFALWERGARQSASYLKRISCGGKDYASRPLTLELGTVLDCDVTAADDAGAVSGRVALGGKPAANLVVVLIPESRVMRRLPSFTRTAATDAAGQYKLAGAVPGDYFVFAVPPSDDRVYFALDFADRHRADAKRVSVTPNGMLVVDLQPPGQRPR